MARDITKLHPELQKKIKELQKACEKQGLKIGIGECVRTKAEQDALYAQGRTKPGSIVTKVKYPDSMHCWGVAFDFYLLMDIDGDGKTNDDTYNNSKKTFEKVGKIGKSIGLEWGGDWSFSDKPHFQLPEWGSTPSKLKSLYGTPEKFMKSWSKKEEPKKETTKKVKAVTKANVNIRDSKGVKIGSVAKGKTIEVVQKEAKSMKINGTVYAMAKIHYGSISGYIAAKYLQYK